MCLLSYIIFHKDAVNACMQVYPKAHTRNTINLLQKESKRTIKNLMINIALYMEVSSGEGGRGRRIEQGKCCQVIGLELGNEKLSLVCGGLRLVSFHLQKKLFSLFSIFNLCSG